MTAEPAMPVAEAQRLVREKIKADHPTWSPREVEFELMRATLNRGDYAVLYGIYRGRSPELGTEEAAHVDAR